MSAWAPGSPASGARTLACTSPAARPPVPSSSANHEFPVWNVEARGRAAFAGEVSGTWLWLVLWPDTAGMLLVEPLPLRDLRDPGQDLDLPFGAPSPQLPG